MTALLNLDLDTDELNAFEKIRNYLIQSKHSTMQRREYTKPGEFHFYDACTLESFTDDKLVISNFRSGPAEEDFYFHLHQVKGKIRVQVLLASIKPDEFVDKVKQIIRLIGETAGQRTGQNSHHVNTPFGYSLWSAVGGEKTLENFEKSISQQVFSRDFSEYCLERNFCLKFRERINK